MRNSPSNTAQQCKYFAIAFIFLLLSFKGFSQPSSRTFEGNLNEITDSDFHNLKHNNSSVYKVNRIGLGTVIIDSTTQLNRLHLLTDFEILSLSISLDTLPKEFLLLKDKVKHLKIDGNNVLKDVSSIHKFNHLKTLGIENFVGKQLSSQKLKLKSLVEFYLSYLPNIENLESITHLNALQSMSISNASKLISFPTLSRRNQLRTLTFIRVTGNIETLKHLKKVRSIYLQKNFWSFPSYLPPNVESITIKGSPSNRLKDISNIAQYDQLQELSFIRTTINDTTSTFPNKSLKRLYIANNQSVGNLNFIFSFQKIESLELSNLGRIAFIEPNIQKGDFKNLKLYNIKNFTNFSPFFHSSIQSSLTIRYSQLNKLPNLEWLKTIPIVVISNNQNLFVEDLIKSNTWRIEKNGNEWNK